MTRAEFLKLPMDERRKILEEQTDKLIAAQMSNEERDTLIKLASEHERYAEFWRTNQNDPHNISTALYVMHLDQAKILRSITL